MPSTKRRTRLPPRVTAAASLALLALFPGCHDDVPNEPQPVAPRVLVGVSVSPAATSIPLGLTGQLTAIATFDDDTSEDATTRVTWASSNPGVAIVDDDASSKGRLSTVRTGEATITATLEGVVGSASVMVAPVVIASIEVRVHPLLPYVRNEGRILAVGALRPFIAVATFTDGTVADVSDASTWTSSDPDHAVADEIAGHRGWVRAVAAGPATLTATLGDVQGAASLTVEPFPALATWIPNTEAPSVGSIGIDGSGHAHAAWSHQFTGGIFGTPPILATSSYDPETGWSAAALIDFGVIDDKPVLPQVAMNASGAALLAWVGAHGIYASVLGPDGWQPARILDSGTSPFLSYGQHLRAAIDGMGNGLVVWANANGDQVFSSRYERSTDTFSAAQPVPSVNRGFANSPLVLVMNPAGAAVLVWEQWAAAWTVQASRFTPGKGHGAGWQNPEIVDDADSWQTASAAIDAAGRIIVTWVDIFPSCSVYARRFDPADGWSPQETLIENDPNSPADALVAVNDAGDAIAVWRNQGNREIRASRIEGGGLWEAPETVGSGSAGDPTVLQPYVAPDGRMLVLWIQESFLNPFRVGQRRYTPAGGWDEVAWLPYFQHLGKLNQIALAFNNSGDGVALWREDYDVFDGQFYDPTSDIFAQSGLKY